MYELQKHIDETVQPPSKIIKEIVPVKTVIGQIEDHDIFEENLEYRL